MEVKSKYFIGGIEGNELKTMVESMVSEAIELKKVAELRELCAAVVRYLTPPVSPPMGQEIIG